MKKYNIIFWISTGLIFITQGVMEFFMLFSEGASAGITALGYPEYFFPMLVVFKILGAIALIVPAIPSRLKEWAYAGFTFDFIAAFISMAVVYGFTSGLLFPIIALIVLGASYVSYHKRRKMKQTMHL